LWYCHKGEIMAATSVTGKGRGSADGKNKGSAHMTLGVAHLVGPRIVMSGTAALSSGSVSLDMPPLAGDDTDYVVIVADTNASAMVATSGTIDASTGTITLGGASSSSHTVAYMVVKTGIAG
jgi:hypothetical protein